MIDWPDDLVLDLARRRAVILIGAGVSRHSTGRDDMRPPLWKEFLEAAINECPNQTNLDAIKEALASNDLLHACEWLKQRFDSSWVGFLRAKFSTPSYQPSEIHKQILKLDSRIVFSLNFDDIYERHVNSIHHGSHITKNYYDDDVSEFLRGDNSYIIKVHGSLNNPSKTIFTQKDYSRARVLNNAFYQAFDATLLTHTFIFIGCGYTDPDINLLLENQNFSYPTNSPHYFLSGDNLHEDRRQSLRENRNIKILNYEPRDNLHSGLIQELDKLNELVETTRYELAKSTNW